MTSKYEAMRYKPTIGEPTWDIKSLDKENRKKIKDRIVMSIVKTEEEYQTVISYLYEKFWDLMDKNPDGMNLQWKYSPHKNKIEVEYPDGSKSDMYAFVYYDSERDYEPIGFGGSYFKEHNITDGSKEEFLLNSGKTQVWGHGYVLFIDPHYRRMGIAQDSWVAEAELYRQLNIQFQYDIQNEHSLKVTQSMFSKPESCPIVSPGRLKNDGTRSGIRILMDYTDEELIKKWEELDENMKNIYGKPYWNFLEREKFSKEELLKHWK